MSRIIAAIALVAIMTGLCISDRIIINKAYDKIYTAVVECEETVDMAINQEKTNEMKEKFQQTEGLLSVYVNHDILDEIAVSLARLQSLSGLSKTDYLSECAAVKLKLDYIKKDSGVNLHSVF